MSRPEQIIELTGKVSSVVDSKIRDINTITGQMRTLALNALIEAARAGGDMVVHVRHEFTDPAMPFFNPGTEGVRIHDTVAPAEGEPVVTKNHVNAFRDTNLKQTLDAAGVDALGLGQHVQVQEHVPLRVVAEP